MRREPGRTCLGCRRVRPKRELVRLVRSARGVVVADALARAAGRGAYVCPEPACVEQALQGRRLAHAFRRPSEAAPGLAASVWAAVEARAVQAVEATSPGR